MSKIGVPAAVYVVGETRQGIRRRQISGRETIADAARVRRRGRRVGEQTSVSGSRLVWCGRIVWARVAYAPSSRGRHRVLRAPSCAEVCG